jgi:predicted Zn-dependent protease
MIPPPERPRFYNFRAKVRRAADVAFNEGRLAFTLARRCWLWIVRGPGRVVGHTVLRRIALGVPAVVVAGAAAMVLAVNPKGDQIKLRSRYRTEAEQALAAGQWEVARVRYQRLAADADYPPDDVYGLARALEGEGRRDDAETLFLRLAPDESTGQPAAHFRRAVQLLAQSPPAARRAEGHLLRAVHARPDYPEAHALLGQLKLNAGDADGATPHLLKAVRLHPELSLPLAEIFAGRDADAAARWAAAAVDHFGPLSKDRPGDADTQFCYVQALHLARRHREAADAVRTALARTDDPRLHQLAGDVYAAWCSILTGDSRAAERIQRIEEGLELSPGAGPLLQALAGAAGGTGPAAVAARASADRRLATGGPAAVGMRLAFGIEAQRRGDVVLARRFIGEAYRDDAASPIAANNLACLLIQEPDPDPARALAIIEAALKNRADEPTLRDTRGQVLVRLGRWQEATRDLEFALSRIPANRDSHRALARAYRGLNLPTLADGQDRKADELPP